MAQVTNLQQGVGANNNGAVLVVNHLNSGLIELTVQGIVTATVNWEGSLDGIVWIPLQAYNNATGIWSFNAVADGTYFVPPLGLNQIRARISSWVAGNITVDAKAVAGNSVIYRTGITAVDLIASPGTVTCTKQAGGAATAGTYNCKVVAGNGFGRTLATAGNAAVTTETTNLTVRLAFAAVPGAEFYDIYCSTDSDPKWVGRITEAQRAAGVRLEAVGVTVGDEAADIAAKIRTALGLNANVSAFFNITGSGTGVILTAKTKAANDATLNIAQVNDTALGLTAAPTSADTTAGVAPVLQVETATIVGSVTGSGNATLVVTAAGMANSPKTISVAVLNLDTASIVATKARAALNLDADVSAFFTIGGTGADISLTAKTAAANDGTMNLASDNGTCTGLTTEGTSANTTAGVVGVAQIETATVAGNITQSGNISVTVTAAGMTGSPVVVSVAVVATDGTAGAVDVQVPGTGNQAATTQTANQAYAPPAAVINCTGQTNLDFDIQYSRTGDTSTAPALSVMPVYHNEISGSSFAGPITALTLGGTGSGANRQRLRIPTYGNDAMALLVVALAGGGATVNIWGVLS